MKHWLFTALVCFGSSAQAAQLGFLPDHYFRPLDLGHLQMVAGALLDPLGSGANDAIGLAPLINHSPKDGCLFPTIVCEDWSLLAVGVGGNLRSDPYLAAGPIINLMPVGKAILLRGLSAVTREGQAANVKDGLKPSLDSSGLDVSISGGPMWVLKPQENFKGYFRLFLGGALKF